MQHFPNRVVVVVFIAKVTSQTILLLLQFIDVVTVAYLVDHKLGLRSQSPMILTLLVDDANAHCKVLHMYACILYMLCVCKKSMRYYYNNYYVDLCPDTRESKGQRSRPRAVIECCFL